MIGFIIYKKNKEGEQRFLEVKSTAQSAETPVWRLDPKDATVFLSRDTANQFMLHRSVEPIWSFRQIYISETEIPRYKLYEDVVSLYPTIVQHNPKYDSRMMIGQLAYLLKEEECRMKMNQKKLPGIKKVIFNDPATIVMWNDGTKTIVKYDEKTRSGKKKKAFDPEKGLAMAIAKKALGNEGNYYETFKKWLPKEGK